MLQQVLTIGLEEGMWGMLRRHNHTKWSHICERSSFKTWVFFSFPTAERGGGGGRVFKSNQCVCSHLRHAGTSYCYCMHERDLPAQKQYHKMSTEDAGDAKSLLANASTSNPWCVLYFSACLIGALVPDSGWLTKEIKIQLTPWGMLYRQIKVHTFGILKMQYHCSHFANLWHRNLGQWSL